MVRLKVMLEGLPNEITPDFNSNMVRLKVRLYFSTQRQ